MADHDTPNSSAPAASKRKKSTPEQRIARLEQQLARAKADQRKTSRRLQTRAKIIVGAASLRMIDGLQADRQQAFLERLWPLITGRDRQALLDSGLLPDAVSLNNTENGDTGSNSSETDEKSGD